MSGTVGECYVEQWSGWIRGLLSKQHNSRTNGSQNYIATHFFIDRMLQFHFSI